MARAAKECCPHNRWDLLRLRDWEAISILVVRGKRGKKQVQKQQVQDVGEVEVTEQWDYGDRCGGGWGSGVLLCACLWPLLWGLGSGRWTQKAPALMTVWSAARGAGPLSKRGHSFCLRSLAGPIQPPPPHTHTSPTPALCPHPSSREGRGRVSFVTRDWTSSQKCTWQTRCTDKVYLRVLRRQIYCQI